MVSFEEAGRMLDEAAEALPQEIFEGLNGGVNLLPARKTDQNGLLVMGTYNVNQMGRYVEIYYGSFRAAHGQAGPDKWRRELTRTLKHELTHHIESLAGTAAWRSGTRGTWPSCWPGCASRWRRRACSSWTRTAAGWPRWPRGCSARR